LFRFSFKFQAFGFEDTESSKKRLLYDNLVKGFALKYSASVGISIVLNMRNDTQHKDMYHNDVQHNDTQPDNKK
jgi:hypothetical protein